MNAQVGLLLCLMCLTAEAREKIDTVIMRNGDRLTGQILVMRHGQLSLKTDYLGTADIEWTDIARIESAQHFVVQHVDGFHYEGTLIAGDQPRALVVSRADGERTQLDFDEIDRVYAGDTGFSNRLTGSFSFGFDYTKATDVSSLNGSFETIYRAPSILWSLSAELNRTDSPDEGTLDRDSFAYTYQWLLRDSNFIAGLSALERHEELGIEARILIGAGLGRYVVQTSRSELAALFGVAVNREWATGEAHAQENVEAVLAANWRIYQFTSPKTNLRASLALYPNLTDTGRHRSRFDLALRRELASDFYFELSLHSSYDSDPPDEEASNSDYGVTSSLGYSFY